MKSLFYDDKDIVEAIQEVDSLLKKLEKKFAELSLEVGRIDYTSNIAFKKAQENDTERIKDDIKAILGIIGYKIDEAHNVPRRIVKIKKGA